MTVVPVEFPGTTLPLLVVVDVMLDLTVVVECPWSLAYVVWPVGVDDTGKRVGVTDVGGFVVPVL